MSVILGLLGLFGIGVKAGGGGVAMLYWLSTGAYIAKMATVLTAAGIGGVSGVVAVIVGFAM